MPSHRFLGRLAVGVAALATLGVAALSGATSAAAVDDSVTPLNSNIVITGAGWGHGKGMSQWGAYGAADAGLSYRQILAFYYPTTTVSTLAAGTRLRVLISADDDGRLDVAPATGLLIKDAAGTTWTLPSGSNYRRWRISRSGSSRVLHYLNASGTWVKKSTPLSASRNWAVSNPDRGYVTVRLPGGSYRDLRDRVWLRFLGTGARTVNSLTMENYLRSVVPSEMPASWPAAAVQAQSVAARSYAARYLVRPLTSVYDICDTTYCQVYRGLATRSGSTRTVHEYEASTAAAQDTAGQVLRSGTAIALTMFSSSNGGWSADGGTPYLVAKEDPYDGRMRNQAWSQAVSSARIQKLFPSIGTFRALKIVDRDGSGSWGGRVDTVTLVGSSGSVTVSGGTFKSRLGLRERLFHAVAGLAPGTGNWDRWQSLGGTTSWVGAPISSEVKVAGGLAARFDGASLYWSSGTGSHYLTGALIGAYARAGGPAGDLGFPRTDTEKGDGYVRAYFQKGRITCPTGKECVVSLG